MRISTEKRNSRIDESGTRINGTLNYRSHNTLTVNAENGLGAPITLTGAFSLANGQRTVSVDGRTDNLGRLMWNIAGSFTITDCRVTLNFRKAST